MGSYEQVDNMDITWITISNIYIYIYSTNNGHARGQQQTIT